jgi:hypothetical protein
MVALAAVHYVMYIIVPGFFPQKIRSTELSTIVSGRFEAVVVVHFDAALWCSHVDWR